MADTVDSLRTCHLRCHTSSGDAPPRDWVTVSRAERNWRGLPSVPSRVKRLIALWGVALAFAACAAAPGSTWPTSPEPLPSAVSSMPAGFGRATWALDPAFPSPDAASTELHVLVWERSCSGGSPTTGRMSPPFVEYTATTATITIGVRPLTGAQTCPGPPGTPALVRLPEPLGPRTLLDGGRVPPAPPTSDF